MNVFDFEMKGNEYLYHGSSNKLRGDKLNPSQGEDSEERPENRLLAVYATDRKDLAIVMAIFGCKDVVGGSIGEYRNNKVNATIYGDFPKQEFVYLYYLPIEKFKQTKIDKHQFVSPVAIKPIKTEKIRVKDFIYLIKTASEEETKKWLLKYGKDSF